MAEIADAHQHVGDLSEALGEPMGQRLSPQEEQRQRVAAMQAQGISWAVIQPAHSYLKPDGIRDTQRVNDGIAAYRAREPELFPIALGTVEPSHGERSLEELERGKLELGLNGFSWHHRLQGTFIDNPWMRPYLSRMAELDLIPMIHTNAESKLEAPWRLQRLAYEFPRLTFIALDAFFSYEQSTEVLFIAERTPNIVWDLGGPHTAGLFSLIEAAVKKLGPERFCFSSNLSYMTGASKRKPGLLVAIEESSLNQQERAQILSGNLRRIFQLPDGAW